MLKRLINIYHYEYRNWRQRKIVNAIDPIKMVVIDKIDNEHLTAVYWSHTQGAYLTITGNINAFVKID